MKKKTAKKAKTIKSYPHRAGDVPVTQAMLFHVRDGINAKFLSIDHRFDAIDSRFESIDKRFEVMENRFDAMEKRFDSLELRITSFEQLFKSESEKARAETHKFMLIIEEQNAKNNIVLDGLTSLFNRQERIEADILEFRK